MTTKLTAIEARDEEIAAMDADGLLRAIAEAKGWTVPKDTPTNRGFVHWVKNGSLTYVPNWPSYVSEAMPLRQEMIDAGLHVNIFGAAHGQCNVVTVCHSRYAQEFETRITSLREAICRAYLMAIARGWVNAKEGDEDA